MFEDVDFHDPIVLAGIGSFALGLTALVCLAGLLMWTAPWLEALRPVLRGLRRTDAGRSGLERSLRRIR